MSTTDASGSSSFRLTGIVPVHNERHVVEASLRRVLAVRDPLLESLEVVTVDDHSDDGSAEALTRLAAEDSRIVVLQHDRTRGKGAAVRTGLERATGDIV